MPSLHARQDPSDLIGRRGGAERRSGFGLSPGLDRGPVQAGVDLQLSGHTHDGQVFPFGLINRLIWKLNWGYLQKGDTQYFVTSGVGTWGPPVRIGSTAEVVRIRLSFKKDWKP